jgi:hypothetical protein
VITDPPHFVGSGSRSGSACPVDPADPKRYQFQANEKAGKVNFFPIFQYAVKGVLSLLLLPYYYKKEEKKIIKIIKNN